jgi:Tfp pilus assembly protein PilV
MLVALVVSLLAIPLVGVVGAAVYGGRDSRYAQEAHERHTVMATVIDKGIENSGMTVVDARWPVATGEHTGPLELTTAATVGERVQIWVDKDGNQVDPPTPTWHAVGDAYGAALAIVLIVSVGLTSLVTYVRSRLDRARDAQWEHELRSLEDGGRTNRH